MCKFVESESNFCVYIHTFPNGKKYVGVTKKDPLVRWGKSGEGYKNQVVYEAIQFYGWENIKHEVVMYNLTKDEASKVEKALIKELDTTSTCKGYNVSSGGIFNLNDGIKVICLNTLEVFPSISEAANRYNFSISTLKQYLHLYPGDNTKYAGKDLKTGEELMWDYYDESKEYTKKVYVGKNRSPKRVICLNTLEIFDSMMDACRAKGINRDDLRAHMKGLYNMCGYDSEGNGLIWEIYDENKEYTKKVFSKEDMHKIRVRCREKNAKRRIICLNSLKVYDSLNDAAKEVNVDASKICSVCRGKRKSAGKGPNGEPLIWEYYNPDKEYKRATLDPKHVIVKKPVYCTELNKTYLCALEASKELGIPKYLIYRSCNSRYAVRGYHFKYV